MSIRFAPDDLVDYLVEQFLEDVKVNNYIDSEVVKYCSTHAFDALDDHSSEQQEMIDQFTKITCGRILAAMIHKL